MAAPQNLTPEARWERDEAIWRLRTQGWTQQQIARQHGITDAAVVYVLNKKRKEYHDAHIEDVEAQIRDEAAALDETIRRWEAVMCASAESGIGLKEREKAAELVLRFRESRRKLLGLDRPAKLEVSGTVVTPIDVELQSLYEQLGIVNPAVPQAADQPVDAPTPLSEVDF